jgi:hypothetical protein
VSTEPLRVVAAKYGVDQGVVLMIRKGEAYREAALADMEGTPERKPLTELRDSQANIDRETGKRLSYED